jgi:hypothetical protein
MLALREITLYVPRLGGMRMRGITAMIVCAGTCGGVCGSAWAGFVPIATSYSLDATARVESSTLALSDTRNISLTSPAMFGSNVAFNESRTTTARMRLLQSDASTEQIARFAGGVLGTATRNEINGQSWTQGRHDGVFDIGSGVSREVDAVARLRFEFAVEETTAYRFSGLPGGQSESGPFDGLPISDVVIAFWSASGPLHEFHNIDFQSSRSGGFDVSGVLTPGIYTIDATTRVRMGLGSIPANDPYTAMLDFNLVTVPSAGPLAMVLLAGVASARRRR